MQEKKKSSNISKKFSSEERWNRRKRLLNYYWQQIFPKRQPTNKVRLSVFLGVFIGVMPTIGVAIVLTVIICKALKLPIGPGVTASFVANPPTQFLFFYPVSYAIGQYFIRPKAIDFDFLEKVKELKLTNLVEMVSWLWNMAAGHVMSFMLGITIVSIITAYIGYFIAHFVMTSKRKDYKEWQENRKHKNFKKKQQNKEGAKNGTDISV